MGTDERLLLRPGTVLLRRNGRAGGTRIQVGLDTRRAVVLDLPAGSCDVVLAALDGTRSAPEVLDGAVARGADPAVAAALLERLREAGALVDAGSWLAWTSDWPADDRARRLPDLHAWDRYDDAAAVTERRRTASVRVVGAGRAGAAVALLLAAAGVGRLEVVDDALVAPSDLTPYGYRGEHVGRPRSRALRDLVATASPATVVTGRARHAEVVVLVPAACEPDRDEVNALIRAGVPHLLVRTHEYGGGVGPFVLPGESACVRCTDLHRTDRDADWPALLAQLTAAAAPVPDTVLAVQLGALAAAQVLHRLVGERPATADGTFEIDLAGGLGEPQHWPPHPCCGCRWPAQFAENDAEGNSLAG